VLVSGEVDGWVAEMGGGLLTLGLGERGLLSPWLCDVELDWEVVWGMMAGMGSCHLGGEQDHVFTDAELVK
jgi:hypothetical protein